MFYMYYLDLESDFNEHEFSVAKKLLTSREEYDDIKNLNISLNFSFGVESSWGSKARILSMQAV